MGYIDYENFLKLPSRITSYIIAIRVSESLKKAKKELDEADIKDIKTRKKLSNTIYNLEAFFNESKRN